MRKLLLMLLALAACNKPVEPAPPPPPLKVLADPSPSMPEGHPALSSLAVSSRGPRRMSIDQLEQSLTSMGDLQASPVKLPADLAVTLGRPDYKRVTEEQLEPTPLFMKFMVDLAGFYCKGLADAEGQRPAGMKFYTRFPTVDENLRFLLLRFTGIEGAEADPYVTRLQAAYSAGAQSTALVLGGYQAVCMSLFTSPEFLLY